MGAWIETVMAMGEMVSPLVAPCVGAWIETSLNKVIFTRDVVAPCVGAWIETVARVRIIQNPLSRTLRGCVD